MYTFITKTSDGKQSLKYAEGNGVGHNNNAERNQFISAVNLMPGSVDSYIEQMDYYWTRRSIKCKNETRRVMQSFSPKELDPENPADILLANQIGIEFAETCFPGHQAVVFTQIDGIGGKIHNHVIVNNVNMHTYRGCTDEQTKFEYVKEGTNAIASQYFDLDPGKDHGKITQAERVKRSQGVYVWKDDLKARIASARDTSTDETTFFATLAATGVETRIGNSKKHGNYITYNLTDRSGFENESPKNGTKCRSYRLESEYGYDAIMSSFGRNKSYQKDIKSESISNSQKKPIINKPANAGNTSGMNQIVEEKREADEVSVFPSFSDWFAKTGMKKEKDLFDKYYDEWKEAKSLAEAPEMVSSVESKDLTVDVNKSPQIASEGSIAISDEERQHRQKKSQEVAAQQAAEAEILRKSLLRSNQPSPFDDMFAEFDEVVDFEFGD